MKKILWISTISFLLFGCSDAGGPLPPSLRDLRSQVISATTDKYSYSLGESIGIELYNGSTASLYLGHCNNRVGFWIERRIDDAWVQSGSVAVVCPAIYPGGTRTIGTKALWKDTISLSDPGTYRFRYQYDSPGLQITNGSLVTNQFTVQ